MAGSFTSLRRALAGASLLISPALAWPQAMVGPFAYHNWTNGQMKKSKPHCVYKGVMSDAEIELCTGYPVHYDYGIAPERSADRSSGRAATSS